ncbi:MAG: M28 family peptidase, partial [Gammaproteobacteria bacterium]
NTALIIDGDVVAMEDFVIPGFSASGEFSAPVVFAGWGIDSNEHNINDYDGVDAKGKIVLVRRYTPKDGVFEDGALQRRLGDLRYKAFT